MSTSRPFNVVVREVNQPPVFSPIADQSVIPGSLLAFVVLATDPDIPHQALTFSLEPGAPSGAAMDPAGRFSWTPTPEQGPSTNLLRVVVTDGAVPSLSVTQAFRVAVSALNRAPVLDPIPEMVIDEGRLLTFTVTARDPDLPRQRLAYALGAGAASGASLDPGTGIFTWTPNEFQGPETNFFTVVVTDDGVPALTGVGSFRIVVNEVNQRPVFTPHPSVIVNVGSPLSFDLEAEDLDIPYAPLVYRLGPGAPAGVAMSPDGTLSWRPAAAQGPSNYLVAVIATDAGVPPLSATNIVEIDVIVGAPLTPPLLRDPVLADGEFQVTLDMVLGRRYNLEASDSPTLPVWRRVDGFQGRGVIDSLIDAAATNPGRIYRVRVE